jgi:hypothetical protein
MGLVRQRVLRINDSISRMHALRILAGILCLCVAVHATSVRLPSFEELVDGSSLVFRGRVTAVQSGWSGDGSQRHLATRVTFQIERAIKGDAAPTLTLEFMGGERDGRRQEIAGLPRFAVGDRGVFFVENREGRLCPITRLRHGRYRLARDDASGVEHVTRDDGSPLLAVADVREPLADSAAQRRAVSVAETMTLDEFERAIVNRARQSPASSAATR